ncbi:MAG: electron transfer flavoprotein subunit beta/FixA family protein [Lentisphaerota bacterium]
MRIIVPVKQVPETKAVKMDEQTGTIIRQGVTSIVNPLDLYAIEAALTLKAQHGAEVIAISMGPPQAAVALRESLAMGIDRAVLISDRAYAGSDTWATARILAAAVRHLGDADLIICGERATDGDTGQVGPELAAALGLPVLTYLNRFDVKDNEFQAGRMVENGIEELAGRLPVLITVVKEIAEPRLPTLDGKIRARQTNIPVLTQSELQIDPDEIGLKGSPTNVVKIFRPKITRQCKLVFAGDEEQASAACHELNNFIQTREGL